MLHHDSLENHFRDMFALMQHHKYSLTELESMIPWERHIYVDMLEIWIQQQAEKAKQK